MLKNRLLYVGLVEPRHLVGNKAPEAKMDEILEAIGRQGPNPPLKDDPDRTLHGDPDDTSIQPPKGAGDNAPPKQPSFGGGSEVEGNFHPNGPIGPLTEG